MEKQKELYEKLKADGFSDLPDYDTFQSALQDKGKREQLHAALLRHYDDVPDFKRFDNALGSRNMTFGENVQHIGKKITDVMDAVVDPEKIEKRSVDDDAASLAAIAKQTPEFVGDAAMAGLYNASSGTVGAVRGVVEPLNRYVAKPVYEAITGQPGAETDKISQALADYQQSIQQSADAAMPQDQTGIASGIASTAQMAANLPLLIANPAAGLGALGAQTAGSAYGEAREAGATPAQSFVHGVSQGAIEVATESIPALKLLGDLKANSGFFKMVANQLMAELPQEQAATVLQDLNDWATLHPDKPFSAYLAERPSAAGQTAVATIVGAGLMSGIATGANRVMQGSPERQTAQAIVQQVNQTDLQTDARMQQIGQPQPQVRQAPVQRETMAEKLAKRGIVIGRNLYGAIEQQESRGNRNAYNPLSKATGPVQITPIFLKEGNQLLGTNYTLREMTDPKKSEQIANAVHGLWIRQFQRRNGRLPDAAEMAMMHHGGPVGYLRPNAKDAHGISNAEYARQVVARMGQPGGMPQGAPVEMPAAPELPGMDRVGDQLPGMDMVQGVPQESQKPAQEAITAVEPTVQSKPESNRAEAGFVDPQQATNEQATIQEQAQEAKPAEAAQSGLPTQPQGEVRAEVASPIATESLAVQKERVSDARETIEKKEPWQMTRNEFNASHLFRGVTDETANNPNTFWGDEGIARSFANARGRNNPRIRIARKQDVPKDALWDDDTPTTVDKELDKRGEFGITAASGLFIPVSYEIPIGGVNNPHEFLVKSAIAEGKPVPPEVLAEYPELQQNAVAAKVADVGKKQGTPVREVDEAGSSKNVKRSKPKGVVDFPNPITGPSGAKIRSYQWMWDWVQEPDKEGEMVDRRVSDWSRSVGNEETGREIVHQFEVEMPDGKRKLVSLETATSALGFTAGQKGLFRSSISAAKTIAKAQMERSVLQAEYDKARKITKDVDALPVPELRITDRGGERGGLSIFLGDKTEVWADKDKYEQDAAYAKERNDVAVRSWKSDQIARRLGLKFGAVNVPENIQRKIAAVDTRIAKAQKKLDSDLAKQPATSPGPEPSTVSGKIEQQLEAAGMYTKEQRKAAGSFVQAFYDAKGKQLGVSPESLYKVHPYRIEGGDVRGDVLEQLAYHGSPYRFELFDASHMGKGEGAQAFGHGVYFAENPEVAKGYKEKLSDPTIKRVKADRYDIDDEKLWIVFAYDENGNVIPKAKGYLTIEDVKNYYGEDVYGLIKKTEYGGDFKNLNIQDGNFYTVDIPDEWIPKMLDWDKPLSEQGPDVIDALGNITNLLREERGKGSKNPDLSEHSGASIYGFVSKVVGSDSKASEYLRALGIPGIKYLDGASRSAGEGSRNYVVFPGNEGEVRILDRNGEPVKPGVLRQLSAPQKLPETIEIDGEQRPTTNSEGRQIHPTEEGVRNFWKWFGDSKVVDEEGRPVVVYHGTNASFDTFNRKKLGENTLDNASDKYYGETSRVGFWFNTEPMAGKKYSPYKNDMPTYLRASAPIGITSLDELAGMIGWVKTTGNGLKNRLKREGYDSVFLSRDEEFGGKSFVVFDRTQIKSATGNSGAFSPADASILRQKGEGETLAGFDPARLTTILTEKATFASFLHETGHAYLDMTAAMASQKGAPKQIKFDMDILLKWFGVKDLAAWNAMNLNQKRKYHEQFAYNFEVYLSEGKTPNAGLKGVFDRFKQWLKEVYRDIKSQVNAAYRAETGEDLPGLTDEVRGVMGRMLADKPYVSKEGAAFRKGNAVPMIAGGKPFADAQYVLIERGDIVASHDPETFRENQKYPQERQNRDYSNLNVRSKAEDAIEGIAKNEFLTLLQPNVESDAGMPTVNKYGIVLSGNNRTFSILRKYGSYRKALNAVNMSQFGLTPADIAAMKEPVLVRLMNDPEAEADFVIASNEQKVKTLTTAEIRKHYRALPTEKKDAARRAVSGVYREFNKADVAKIDTFLSNLQLSDLPSGVLRNLKESSALADSDMQDNAFTSTGIDKVKMLALTLLNEDMQVNESALDFLTDRKEGNGNLDRKFDAAIGDLFLLRSEMPEILEKEMADLGAALMRRISVLTTPAPYQAQSKELSAQKAIRGATVEDDPLNVNASTYYRALASDTIGPLKKIVSDKVSRQEDMFASAFAEDAKLGKPGASTYAGEGELKKKTFKEHAGLKGREMVIEKESGERPRYKTPYYEVITNAQTVEEAVELSIDRTIDEIETAIRDRSVLIAPHVRVALAELTLKRLSEQYRKTKDAGILERQNDLADFITDYAEETGRTLQAFSLYKSLTPEGVLVAYNRAKRKAEKAHYEKNQPDVDDVIGAVGKGDKEQKSRKLKDLLRQRNRVARKIRPLFERIVEASELGAFGKQEFYDIVGPKLGLPEYSEDVARRLMELADAVQLAPEGIPQEKAIAELHRFMAKHVGFGVQDLPLGIYYGNILSGYMTHAVNIADTFANVVSEVNNLAISNPKAAAFVYAQFIRGFNEGRYDAVLAWSEGRRLSDGKWYEGARFMDIAEFGKPGGVPIIKKSALSRYVKVLAESKAATPLNMWKYVTRLLTAEDALMWRPSHEARAALLAFKLAEAQGLRGSALIDRASSILNLRDITPYVDQAKREGFAGSEAMARAVELRDMSRPAILNEDAKEWAGEATYNHTPRGLLGLVAKQTQILTNKVPPLKFLVPFTQIVANVTNRGLNWTPYGFKRAYYGHFFGDPLNAEQRQAMLVRATVGTSALVGVAALNALGAIVLHGHGPEDDKERYQMMNGGWIPYSVEIDGKYISYANTPIGLGLAVLGNAIDMQRYGTGDDESTGNRLAMAVLMIGNTVFSQSFLSGLSGFFESLTSDNPGQAMAAWKSLVSRTVSGLSTPNALRDTYRFFDPKAYRASSFMEAIVKNTPFAASAGLKPALNALGQPIYPLGAGATAAQRNRFFGVKSGDPVWRYVMDSGIRISVPSATTEIDLQNDIRMTPDQYYEYHKEQGQDLYRYIEQNLPRLKEMEKEDAEEVVNNYGKRNRKRILSRMRREFRP